MKRKNVLKIIPTKAHSLEIDNLYSHISTKEIQRVFQNLLTKKAPSPGGFTGDIFQTCKKEISIHTNSSRK